MASGPDDALRAASDCTTDSWAHGLFDDEPWLRPKLIGRELVPVIDDHGLEQGLEQGLLEGRREALALVLELRGLVPNELEQRRIDDCRDCETLERWCRRAKTATRVAELFR